MRIVRRITNNKFINLKEVKDEEKGVGGYQFAERLGVDSVAFVCYDSSDSNILVNKEYKPPIDEFIIGAFGGSMDKDGKSPQEIVKEEVKEEAGFVVDEGDIKYVGKCFVSTQMNQFCYLFLVNVNKDNQEEREPENAVEEAAKTIWMNIDDVFELQDWKAIVICKKAKNKGLLK